MVGKVVGLVVGSAVVVGAVVVVVGGGGVAGGGGAGCVVALGGSVTLGFQVGFRMHKPTLRTVTLRLWWQFQRRKWHSDQYTIPLLPQTTGPIQGHLKLQGSL